MNGEPSIVSRGARPVNVNSRKEDRSFRIPQSAIRILHSVVVWLAAWLVGEAVGAVNLFFAFVLFRVVIWVGQRLNVDEKLEAVGWAGTCYRAWIGGEVLVWLIGLSALVNAEASLFFFMLIWTLVSEYLTWWIAAFTILAGPRYKWVSLWGAGGAVLIGLLSLILAALVAVGIVAASRVAAPWVGQIGARFVIAALTGFVTGLALARLLAHSNPRVPQHATRNL